MIFLFKKSSITYKFLLLHLKRCCFAGLVSRYNPFSSTDDDRAIYSVAISESLAQLATSDAKIITLVFHFLVFLNINSLY